MGVYTVTVTLTPEEDAALQARARAPVAAPVGVPSPVGVLREEYHDLVHRELAGTLLPGQAARLAAVNAALDDLEARDPATQVADARMRETSDRLDAILAELQRLPRMPDAA